MAQSTPTNLQLTTVYPISSQLIQSLMNVVHSATNERWPFSTYQIRQQSICKGGPTTMDFTSYLKASITCTRKFIQDVICIQSVSSLYAGQPSPSPRPSPCLSPSTLPLLPLSPPVFIASISRRGQFHCPTIFQELCESRAGRPGLSVLYLTSGFRGRKAILNHASALVSACP